MRAHRRWRSESVDLPGGAKVSARNSQTVLRFPGLGKPVLPSLFQKHTRPLGVTLPAWGRLSASK